MRIITDKNDFTLTDNFAIIWSSDDCIQKDVCSTAVRGSGKLNRGWPIIHRPMHRNVEKNIALEVYDLHASCVSFSIANGP